MQPVPPPATACGRDARRPRRGALAAADAAAAAGLAPRRLPGRDRPGHRAELRGRAAAARSGHGACSGPRPRGRRLRPQLLHGWPAAPPAMMPGQIPDPSVTAGSLPGLGPLTGLPSSALTVEELKYADIRNLGAMIAPLHFLEVKLGKRPQPVKSEVSKNCRGLLGAWPWWQTGRLQAGPGSQMYFVWPAQCFKRNANPHFT
nr:jun dimerization protein 2 isoform X2 [Chlorocebus sabaeus]